MTIRTYLKVLRSNWLLIAALITLGATVGGVATFFSTRVYEARAQLFVSAQAASASGGLSDAYQGGLFTQQRVKSYADIVTSPAVLDKVRRDLRLPGDSNSLARRVATEVPPDTVLINVSITDTDPRRAADIANAVSRQFSEVVPRLETTADDRPPPVKVSLVRPADVPTGPVSPRPTLNVAMGLLVGLALGIGLAVLRASLDTRIKGTSDLQKITGATPLGLIGYNPDASKQPLVVHDAPQSPRAEAFRQLRTNLRFVDVDSPPRVVVVTSSVSGEGKSTTSCNLAITLAQSGARVVLVEGDLRRPKVADYLGIEGAVGLTNVLVGGCALEDALQPWGRDLLDVLPSGAIPPNPAELLGSHHMLELLKMLEERADIVIVDAPPLLPVTDAAILSRAGDGALLVVRHGRTKREQVERSVETLRAVDARLLGTVMNWLPPKDPEAYAYGYAYRYTADGGSRPRLDAPAAAADTRSSVS